MEFDDTFELELLTPVTVGEVVHRRLTLSEPTGEQLVAAEKAVGMASLMILINQNAKVPMAVVNQLRQRDLQRAADFLSHFANGPLPSSPSSSPS